MHASRSLHNAHGAVADRCPEPQMQAAQITSHSLRCAPCTTNMHPTMPWLVSRRHLGHGGVPCPVLPAASALRRSEHLHAVTHVSMSVLCSSCTSCLQVDLCVCGPAGCRHREESRAALIGAASICTKSRLGCSSIAQRCHCSGLQYHAHHVGRPVPHRIHSRASHKQARSQLYSVF
jgi:hypothetical protein